jgi:hypothetical protein
MLQSLPGHQSFPGFALVFSQPESFAKHPITKVSLKMAHSSNVFSEVKFF